MNQTIFTVIGEYGERYQEQNVIFSGSFSTLVKAEQAVKTAGSINTR